MNEALAFVASAGIVAGVSGFLIEFVWWVAKKREK